MDDENVVHTHNGILFRWKEFVSFDSFYSYFPPTSSTSALILIIAFCLLIWGLNWSCFPKTLKYNIKLFTWDFIKTLSVICFYFISAFIISYWSWHAIFFFSFNSRFFFITYWFVQWPTHHKIVHCLIFMSLLFTIISLNIGF